MQIQIGKVPIEIKATDGIMWCHCGRENKKLFASYL